ncbi:hypothetical protein IKQ26_07495 [bacterium]|nr:hypothetical protein [bacterium]
MKIFHNYRFLLFTVCLLFFVYTFFYIRNAMGLFFDIPALTINSMNFSLFHHGIIFHLDERVRLATNFLVAIPNNLIVQFFSPHFLLSYLKSFSSSYLIVMFISWLLAFAVAKRTKRYDVITAGFALFCLCSIPNFCWVAREIHIAMIYNFMLLAYFLSESKLTKHDFIPVTLLLIYSFESYETTLFLAALLFIFYFVFEYKMEDINLPYKRYIGLTSVFIIPYMTIRMVFLDGHGFDSSLAMSQMLFSSVYTVQNLFHGTLLISFIALLVITFSVFYKKAFTIKSLFIFIPFIAVVLFFYNKFIGFQLFPNTDLHYHAIIMWIMPVIFLYFLVISAKGIKVSKDFIKNLFAISCVCAIIHLSIQTGSAVQFGQYFNFMKNKLETSPESVIVLSDEEMDQPFMVFASCYGTEHLSLFLTENYKKHKIFLPNTDYMGNVPGCFLEDTFIDRNDHLSLQGTFLKKETKYWDLSELYENLRENNIVPNEE